MNTLNAHAASVWAGATVFARVVAGVDGSDPGFEAARQAARLVAPDGWLETFTAVDLAQASRAGWGAPQIRAELEQEAAESARKGAGIAGPRVESRLVTGRPLPSLMRELGEKEATLAVVGTHGHSRVSEMLIGGVAGELLHRAPCSVCVARPPLAEAVFPRAVVVGVDGSLESEAAAAVARYLAARFSVPVSLVTAVGGKNVRRQRAAELGAVEVEGRPVDALIEASRDADILVIGSRGLHGVKALGSVSERVAHEANCSALVVRGST
jgi:nucleotide-binding universal stress UspA family protein